MNTMIGARATDGRDLQATEQALDRLARTARPDVVFGQPVERGDTTIIPCCEIALGMGTGSGSGTSPTRRDTREAASERDTTGISSGEGAGGGARGCPVAVIVLAHGTVRVEPVVDATRIALAALTTAGFMAFWIARLIGAVRATPATVMVPVAQTRGPWWARLPGIPGMPRR